MFYFCVINSCIYKIKKYLSDLEGNNYVVYQEYIFKKIPVRGEMVYDLVLRSNRRESVATEKRFGETFFKLSDHDLNNISENIN